MQFCQNGKMVRIRVYVSLKPSLLDSAGRAVTGSLKKLGYEGVQQTRIGKLIELEMDSFDEATVHEMCQKLLANPVIEDYQFEVVP